ncbi:hypothetical protein SAY86_006127 [Trapa natans]|uniref:Association with the SNF1 complex (ASC) domain-containing protein n=1 Tax=Trapa natans TaxID=22666 RepID=A0AAN7L604_TRANT|nr:hypothetical protein SAY86_006127 [Trapa natans]
MGNVSGRGGREGTSGAYYDYGDRSKRRPLMGAQSGSRHEHLVHSTPSPRMSGSNHLHVPMTDADYACSEKMTPVMITWSHGGQKVAISGSWDDWQTIEPMRRSGKDFILVKVIPYGVYHFRFFVDGHLRYDPDFPCDFNDPRGAFNIMDLKECAAENRESISDLELPPSPDGTYSSNSLIEEDFSKPPPDLPPQLHRTPLNEMGFGDSYHRELSKPPLPVLNHLYVKNWDLGETVTFGSTHRFLEKCVTVILYKPSWKRM